MQPFADGAPVSTFRGCTQPAVVRAPSLRFGVAAERCLLCACDWKATRDDSRKGCAGQNAPPSTSARIRSWYSARGASVSALLQARLT
jgi:hypothetical protein